MKILLTTIFIVACLAQTPQNVPKTQNYIEPTVFNNQNTIPATETPTVTSNNNPNPGNAQPSEGVLLSNAALHGLEGQAIPIPTQQHPQSPQAPKHEMTPQEIASAKQKAEKARQMAQDARRQAESDRKRRDQKEDEQLRTIQMDQTLSKTERKKQEEKLLFRKVARSVQDGTKFTEYLFEQGLGSSQFFIKIPATQQVAINFYTYVAQDNTYVRTKNIEEEEAVRVYIYENNQRVVYEGEFYYQNYIVFQGQADAMYLIRVVNNGKTKLISMNTKKLVEESHIQDALQKHDGQHVDRTQNLAIDINKWYQEFRKIRMLDFQDLKAVEGYIEKYYSWEVFETIIAVVVCIFQIKMIQSMLKGNTIV